MMKRLLPSAALVVLIAGFSGPLQAQVRSIEGVALSPLPVVIGTKFNFGILFRADFSNAQLGPGYENEKGRKVITLFEGAHLQGANFDGANVQDAIFRD